jgi:hypothetical protein
MFSIKNYKKLLSSIKKQGYHVRPIFGFDGKAKKPTILLRFDVDYYPQMAVKIAEINIKLNVSGTFFFQMDSPLYNLWAPKTQKILKRISELKQEIGWHTSFIPKKTTRRSLITGGKAFKQAMPRAIPLISWHNPQKNLLNKANAVVKSTNLLKSVYTTPFISKKIKYLSDSNRRNGFKDLMNILQVDKNPRVQLLLHPLNWVIGGDDMKTILKSVWNALLKDMNKEFSVNPNWRRLI